MPHRCEHVATVNEVMYIDDSKGTNVGATIAALNGFGVAGQANLVLIAGGQGKDQDFSQLKSSLAQFVKLLLLFGEDAARIENALQGATEVKFCESLQDAVAQAETVAEPGDIVLLSPACASFDMFSGFEERGRVFQSAVKAVAA